MPWSATTPMDQRTLFVADAQRALGSWRELCARYHISRKTGYKWLARFQAQGPRGLVERSRRPLHSPTAAPAALVESLLEARRHHPSWGPKKLLALVRRREPRAPWPAASTVARLLHQHGLIPPRRRRRPLGHPGRPLTPMRAPNEIWTADFKGQFRTGDGRYCYPLTVVDGYSRFLLACHGLLAPTHDGAQPIFERLFREVGLPRIIRTDNGVPFASCALGRLSRLSVWWIRLGIYPELIQPAHPEQNGRHERFHRTLKAETTRPAAATCRSQQHRFTVYRELYNQERPHEALGQRTPASRYRPSRRPFPSPLPALAYPKHFEIRYVSRNGGIRWQNRWVNISHVLDQQHVGFDEIDDGRWDVYFGPVWLGRFDERTARVTFFDRVTPHQKVVPMS